MPRSSVQTSFEKEPDEPQKSTLYVLTALFLVVLGSVPATILP